MALEVRHNTGGSWELGQLWVNSSFEQNSGADHCYLLSLEQGRRSGVVFFLKWSQRTDLASRGPGMTSDSIRPSGTQ